MAIEFTLLCDGCGRMIVVTRKGARAARAAAQLDHGAYCGPGVDRCAACRLERGKALLATMVGHSVGTQR